MTARQVHRVLAVAALAVELNSWIDRHYATPAADLPDLSETDGLAPAIVAEQLRSAWDLHSAPVKSMLSLLEHRGVRVFSLPLLDREIDAFSYYHEGRPFVFINTSKTAERIRFDLSHELGHLLLHRYRKKNRSRLIEQEAQDFAASFLIPADGLHPQIIGPLRLDDVFKLKRYWKVSAVAMVERLRQLEYISEWTHRRWMIDLSQRGFRTGEPEGIHPEGSKLLSQLFRIAREDGWPARKIAAALHVGEDDLDALVFGLAMAVIRGEGGGGPVVTGHLTRVK